MNRSCVPALAACILAVPPLALKVQRYSQLSRVDRSQEARLLDALNRERYETTVERLPDNRFLIHAKQDACVIDLREVAPSGFDQTAMATFAAGRRLFYVDAGTTSSEQPVWRTWAYFHFRRFASFVGWSLPKRLTMAVTASRSCHDFDWSDLSKRDVAGQETGATTETR